MPGEDRRGGRSRIGSERGRIVCLRASCNGEGQETERARFGGIGRIGRGFYLVHDAVGVFPEEVGRALDLRIAHAVTDEDENVFGPCREGGRPVVVQGVLLVDSLCEKPERGEKEQGAKKIADKLDSFFHFVLLVQNLQEECERSVRQLSENRERKIGILCGYTNELRIEWPLVQWIRICPGCRIAKKSSCGNGKDA